MTEALAKTKNITDESSAMESLCRQTALVQGRPDNIKITHPDDLDLAEILLKKLLEREQNENRPRL